MIGNNFLLWENEEFIVKTPFNPQIQYKEGLHIIVAPKKDYKTAWEDPEVSARAFKLATQTCKYIQELNLAPWFNIQANGNWGLLPGSTPFFHLHIYGRNKTESWGKPIELPVLPKTYQNEPMPEQTRILITETLGQALKHL